MTIFDSTQTLSDVIQGGFLDIGAKTVEKKSNTYSFSSQDTYAPVTSYDYTSTYSPALTYAPQYLINSAGATQTGTPTTTTQFTKKTDLYSAPTQTASQIPTTVQGSINSGSDGGNGIFDNITDLATIGLIGAGLFVGYNIFIKKKKK